jgi:hypothetical protein
MAEEMREVGKVAIARGGGDALEFTVRFLRDGMANPLDADGNLAGLRCLAVKLAERVPQWLAVRRPRERRTNPSSLWSQDLGLFSISTPSM